MCSFYSTAFVSYIKKTVSKTHQRFHCSLVNLLKHSWFSLITMSTVCISCEHVFNRGHFSFMPHPLKETNNSLLCVLSSVCRAGQAAEKWGHLLYFFIEVFNNSFSWVLIPSSWKPTSSSSLRSFDPIPHPLLLKSDIHLVQAFLLEASEIHERPGSSGRDRVLLFVCSPFDT